MIYQESTIEMNGHKAKFRSYIPVEAPECAYKGKRPAVVILPGGAYRITYEGEAEPVALKLCAEGICAFVLEYATFPDGQVFPVALAEAFHALRQVRDNAEKYGIDAHNIAILGFSAGGHLASSVGTLLEAACLDPYLPGNREAYRADKMILCYPVISTDESFCHKGSFENLFGKAFDELTLEEKTLVSTEKQVGTHTPPALIWSTSEDGSVPPQNAMAMAMALATHGIPFELYVYPHGGHGLCTGDHTSMEMPFGERPECAEWTGKAVRFMYDRTMLPEGEL